MKQLVFAAALAALLSGCKDEAERFGYVGADLEQSEPLYVVRGTVTNWMPARVLRVVERYELSEAETNVVRSFGLIDSGMSFKEAPAGYRKRDVEPWFTTWVKDNATAFGRKGTAGFLSHLDPDTGVWSTGETFFSTYHDTIDAARADLEQTVKDIDGACRPLKFHRFEDTVVAEYRRLRVICVVGPCASGKFACMLSVTDKNEPGCGECVPLAEQQEMLDDYLFAKAVRAWDAECARLAGANHDAVAKAAAARKLKLFGDAPEVQWARGGNNGSFVAGRTEEFDWKKGDPRRDALMADTVRSAAAAFGVTFGEPVTNVCEACFAELSAVGTNDLFDVMVSVRFADPPEEDKKTGGEAPPPPDLKPVAMRVEAAERLQKDFAFPPYPAMPKR